LPQLASIYKLRNYGAYDQLFTINLANLEKSLDRLPINDNTRDIFNNVYECASKSNIAPLYNYFMSRDDFAGFDSYWTVKNLARKLHLSGNIDASIMRRLLNEPQHLTKDFQVDLCSEFLYNGSSAKNIVNFYCNQGTDLLVELDSSAAFVYLSLCMSRTAPYRGEETELFELLIGNIDKMSVNEIDDMVRLACLGNKDKLLSSIIDHTSRCYFSSNQKSTRSGSTSSSSITLFSSALAICCHKSHTACLEILLASYQKAELSLKDHAIIDSCPNKNYSQEVNNLLQDFKLGYQSRINTQASLPCMLEPPKYDTQNQNEVSPVESNAPNLNNNN